MWNTNTSNRSFFFPEEKTEALARREQATSQAGFGIVKVLTLRNSVDTPMRLLMIGQAICGCGNFDNSNDYLVSSSWWGLSQQPRQLPHSCGCWQFLQHLRLLRLLLRRRLLWWQWWLPDHWQLLWPVVMVATDVNAWPLAFYGGIRDYDGGCGSDGNRGGRNNYLIINNANSSNNLLVNDSCGGLLQQK